MKKILSITAIALVFTLFSCNKEECKSMTIVRDCSGTYLQIDGKDFLVCNLERLSSMSNGTQVTASYRKIDDCPSLRERCICKIGHKSYGWVEVVDIK